MCIVATPIKDRSVPFVYGSLRDPDIRAAVLDQNIAAIDVSPAWLPGHALFRVQGRSYPMIAACRHATVEGLLLAGLTTEQLRHLDIFEGDEYIRGPVQVIDGEAREIRAQVYRPCTGLRRDRRRWSLEHWAPRERRAMLTGIKAWRRRTRRSAADIMAP